MQHVPHFLRLAVCVCLALGAAALPAKAELNARAAILMDMSSGKILYAQDADAGIAPASLTKIMTMYVVMDQLQAGKVRLSDKVTVSRNASRQRGSRMHLRTGEKVSLDSLLAGVAVSSGNDAAIAVAEHVAGSVGDFVRLMNDKARKLGLKGTSFSNPNGLPARGQETTARDMLNLSVSYLKAHPSAIRYHYMLAIKHRRYLMINKNPLLNSCPGADGIKTGFIRESGYNLVSTVKRGDTRLVGVVLGSASARIRAEEMRDLIEAGFMTLHSDGKVKVDEVLSKRSTPFGQRANVRTNSVHASRGGKTS